MSVSTYLNGQLVRVAGVDSYTNGQNIQISVMPAASALYENKIYQYIGALQDNYVTGYFYQCVQSDTGKHTATAVYDEDDNLLYIVRFLGYTKIGCDLDENILHEKPEMGDTGYFLFEVEYNGEIYYSTLLYMPGTSSGGFRIMQADTEQWLPNNVTPSEEDEISFIVFTDPYNEKGLKLIGKNGDTWSYQRDLDYIDAVTFAPNTIPASVKTVTVTRDDQGGGTSYEWVNIQVQPAGENVTVVNTVEEDNMNAVTSNAVYNAIKNSSTTFIGTSAQWNALTLQEKLSYDISNITDD